MSGSRVFPGGVHPKEGVNGKAVTKGMPIKEYVAPRVVISMFQHVGIDCKPVVQAGERVLLGQVIGEPTSATAVPIHSSVSGTVVSIDKILLPNGMQTKGIVIDNDFQDKWVELQPMEDPNQLTAEKLKEIVFQAGIVGQGGAMFPT